MLERLKKLEFVPHNLNAQTISAAIVLYLLVVACCLWSLYERNDRSASRAVRAMWAIIIVLLPVVGILAYLPFSLGYSSFSISGFWRRPR